MPLTRGIFSTALYLMLLHSYIHGFKYLYYITYFHGFLYTQGGLQRKHLDPILKMMVVFQCPFVAIPFSPDGHSQGTRGHCSGCSSVQRENVCV